ncbi:MAG TPA: hypothetical protein VGI14_18415 [Casimicrobiaceae bacterium]
MNTASPPEQPAPLFIDRDAWSNALDAALRGNGVQFVAHKDVFADDSKDVEWIARVSAEGWIGITRDKNIRTRANEIAMIRASKAMICVFTSGNLSATATAETLVKALPRIFERWRHRDRPVVYSIHRDGTLSSLSLKE